jgi:uncharacterized membrane protein
MPNTFASESSSAFRLTWLLAVLFLRGDCLPVHGKHHRLASERSFLSRRGGNLPFISPSKKNSSEAVSLRKESPTERNPQLSSHEHLPTEKLGRKKIQVSSEMDIDIPIEMAFDAFADLPRQPSWSTWLSSVEYIGPPGDEKRETLWKMGAFGTTISWNAISTKLERPFVVAWESTKGFKNFGLVEFEALSNNSTRMKLTITFVPPLFTAGVLGFSGLARVVESRMLRPTLRNFRNVVAENDLKTVGNLN